MSAFEFNTKTETNKKHITGSVKMHRHLRPAFTGFPTRRGDQGCVCVCASVRHGYAASLSEWQRLIKPSVTPHFWAHLTSTFSLNQRSSSFAALLIFLFPSQTHTKHWRGCRNYRSHRVFIPVLLKKKKRLFSGLFWASKAQCVTFQGIWWQWNWIKKNTYVSFYADKINDCCVFIS